MLTTGARIVLLNGATSSGKSTIAAELQLLMPEPYLHLGIDLFTRMLPQRYWTFKDPQEDAFAREGFHWITVEDGGETWGGIGAGPVAQALMRGMHRACAGLASAGNNLIVDDVLIDPTWLLDYMTVLGDFEVYFVGVYCPLEVLEVRERKRANRRSGMARGQARIVHRNHPYDLELDTSRNSPQECAKLIKSRIEEGPPPSAFREIRARLSSDSSGDT